MSEEKDASSENQNEPHAKLNADEIKEKLKDLGVMQDENAAPQRKKSSFLKGKWPVLVAVVAALILWWWVTGTEQSSDELVSDETQPVTTIPHSLPGEGNQPAGPPPYTMPPPPAYPPVARDADGRLAPPPGAMPDAYYPQQRNVPGSRSDDRYGPPPGYGAYPPPQWPGYYGPPPGYGYGPGYYGPAPGWGGYYPPPMYYRPGY